jgi:hypothetical protein
VHVSLQDLVHEAHLLLWAVGERKPRKLPLSTCAMVASDAPRNWQAILVSLALLCLSTLCVCDGAVAVCWALKTVSQPLLWQCWNWDGFVNRSQ